ncbi:hypothetical protein CALVIDRAFT_542847, partial [Calocera viscosa TUFC12733]
MCGGKASETRRQNQSSRHWSGTHFGPPSTRKHQSLSVCTQAGIGYCTLSSKAS